MLNTPERQAREDIDRLLQAAGWIVQDRRDMHLPEGLGVAVREFQLTTGAADYLLFIDEQPVGVIEAKKTNAPLSGYEGQAQRYSEGLPPQFKPPFNPLPFQYQSTGKETRFTNALDPMPRSRHVFAFHKPETLQAWIKEGMKTLRWRFGNSYGAVVTKRLWRAQEQAITELEESLAAGHERALIQMATGSGKTFTAINFIYRMLESAKVQRVLFLVDRNNLARQTLAEFQNFDTPDDGRKFTALHNVQHLTSNSLDDDSKVTITTIQRLYSMLRGEAQLDPAEEERGLEEAPRSERPKEVAYNPRIPIEYFDVIVTDECHRSIYNTWRQVLDYFDAFLIGMTATPDKRTFGFFNRNLVMEYSREDAVIDGVNVPGEVYSIRTQITQEGSKIEAGFAVPKRDRKTRIQRIEQLDDDFEYEAAQLDMSVVTPDQIRTVIRTFRDKLPEIFPGRTIVPKTLIFAKDDSHAEDIVHIVRQEFAQGNDFCQKITYRVDGNPEDLIARFRNSYYPRIAVTVDMIATGTDVRAIECLLFMRLVKSAGLFEQMQGRGVRVIQQTDLKQVTPDADNKDRFVIVDAVGAIDQAKTEVVTLERDRSIKFGKLLDNIAAGDNSDDTFITLAGRLARLNRKLRASDVQAISDASKGLDLRDIADQILKATELDEHIKRAETMNAGIEPTEDQIQAAETQLKREVRAMLNPKLRNLLNDIQARDEMVIDDVSLDTVTFAGFTDDTGAQTVIQSFRQFIEANRDEIGALQVLYGIPYQTQRLAWSQLRELDERLKTSPYQLTPEKLWAAYAKVEPDRVKMGGTKRLLTDLIALVRHALQPDSELIPYPESVQARYRAWLQAQAQGGRVFTSAQQTWLDAIAEHIGVNLAVETKDFNDGKLLERGGIQGAINAFKDASTLKALLDELNATLAA